MWGKSFLQWKLNTTQSHILLLWKIPSKEVDAQNVSPKHKQYAAYILTRLYYTGHIRLLPFSLWMYSLASTHLLSTTQQGHMATQIYTRLHKGIRGYTLNNNWKWKTGALMLTKNRISRELRKSIPGGIWTQWCYRPVCDRFMLINKCSTIRIGKSIANCYMRSWAIVRAAFSYISVTRTISFTLLKQSANY